MPPNLNVEDVAVIVPAFNESSKVGETLADLANYFESQNLIVIDDGSSDETHKIAASCGATVLKHPINLGQGASIQTGISHALLNEKFNYFLTFDSDGQHSTSSALEMIKEIKYSDVDIILGSRFLGQTKTNMPTRKLIILKLGILFTRLDSGLNVTDTHNGLRVMNRKFAEGLEIRHAGMAHASEILSYVKSSKAKWKEHPTQIFYSNYSIRKGQSILNAINILTEMMFK